MAALYDLCQYSGPHNNANKNTSRNFPCLHHIALTNLHLLQIFTINNPRSFDACITVVRLQVIYTNKLAEKRSYKDSPNFTISTEEKDSMDFLRLQDTFLSNMCFFFGEDDGIPLI